MNQRLLGNSGLPVSEITLGTVELGVNYGFRGSEHYAKPARDEGVSVIRHAVERGINLLDTAPAYGESESVIGDAGAPCYVATKVTLPATAEQVVASVDRSLRLLRRERVEVLQLHNPTLETIGDAGLLEGLQRVLDAGKVGMVGASAYGEEIALAALENPMFRTLQVPFNILDQGMTERVFPLAQRNGVGVLVRSVFLRGVLTARIHGIPERLGKLRERGLAALGGEPVERLPALAIRFCLSFPAISSLILGIRTVEELDENLKAAAEGPLDVGTLERLKALSMSEDPMVSPMNWQDLI
ncbi:MAG: aldo/keto reductase [Bryobacterales bacterium]|nr:aldo/keto reductase [Bryobacterales bacterium]